MGIAVKRWCGLGMGHRVVGCVVGAINGLGFRQGFEMFFVHINLPDANGVVGTAGCKKFNVGRQQEAC